MSDVDGIQERFSVTFKKENNGQLKNAQSEFLKAYVDDTQDQNKKAERENLAQLIQNENVDMVKISGIGETTIGNTSDLFNPENNNEVVAKYVRGADNNGVVVQVHSKENAGNRFTNDIMNNMTGPSTEPVIDLLDYISSNASNVLPPDDKMYVDMTPHPKKKEVEIMTATKDLNISDSIQVLPHDMSFYKGKNKDYNYLVYSSEPMLPRRYGDGNVVRDLVGRCLMIGIPVSEGSFPIRMHRTVFGFVVVFYDKNDELIKKVPNLQRGADDSLYGVLYFDPNDNNDNNDITIIDDNVLTFVNPSQETKKTKDEHLTHVSSSSNPRWKNLPKWVDQQHRDKSNPKHGNKGDLEHSHFMNTINTYKEKISEIIRELLSVTSGGAEAEAESTGGGFGPELKEELAAEVQKRADNENAKNMGNLKMKFGIFSLARQHATGFTGVSGIREYIGLPYTILGSPYGIVSYGGVKTKKMTLQKSRVMFHDEIENDESHLIKLFSIYAEEPTAVKDFFNAVYKNDYEQKSFYAGMMLCFKEYFLRSALMNKRDNQTFISAERDTMSILMPEWNSMSNLINQYTWKDQNSKNAHGITDRFLFGVGGQGKTKKKLPLTYKKTTKDKRKSKIKRKRKTKGNTNI